MEIDLAPENQERSRGEESYSYDSSPPKDDILSNSVVPPFQEVQMSAPEASEAEPERENESSARISSGPPKIISPEPSVTAPVEE